MSESKAKQFSTRIEKLSDWIYAIDQQMVRAFVLVGEKRALCVDTGVNPIDIQAHIRSITDLPVTLCLTHSDRDHVANLDQFGEAFVHPAERPLLQSFPQVRFHEVREGDSFDLGGKRLTVVDCPGHTPGSIALLEEEEKVLFSGDTVSLGPVYLFGLHRDTKRYRETLCRLKQMAADGRFCTVYPCHNLCPVGPEILADLISCTDGILDGSISGKPAGLTGPGRENVQLYQSGRCGIYWEKAEKDRASFLTIS